MTEDNEPVITEQMKNYLDGYNKLGFFPIFLLIGGLAKLFNISIANAVKIYEYWSKNKK